MAKPPEAASELCALFPTLTAEELEGAKESLDRYIESTLRLYEAICNDPERYARFKALTQSREPPRMDQDVVC